MAAQKTRTLIEFPDGKPTMKWAIKVWDTWVRKNYPELDGPAKDQFKLALKIFQGDRRALQERSRSKNR